MPGIANWIAVVNLTGPKGEHVNGHEVTVPFRDDITNPEVNELFEAKLRTLLDRDGYSDWTYTYVRVTKP
jgi:hypothetical protein